MSILNFGKRAALALCVVASLGLGACVDPGLPDLPDGTVPNLPPVEGFPVLAKADIVEEAVAPDPQPVVERCNSESDCAPAVCTCAFETPLPVRRVCARHECVSVECPILCQAVDFPDGDAPVPN